MGAAARVHRAARGRRSLARPLDEVVDQPARDRERPGDLRQLLWPEPAGLAQLVLVDPELVAERPCDEPDHQLTREWPGLAAEVAHVTDLDARLLAHLAADGLLESLTGLDEAGEDAGERELETGAPREQHAPLVLDEHDHGG